MSTTEIVHVGFEALLSVCTFWAVLVAKRPQRNRISFDFVPASKEALDRHIAWDEAAHRELDARLGGMDRGAAEKMEAITKEWRAFVERKFSELTAGDNEGRERLWEKLSRVGEDVSALRADSESSKKRIEELDKKIDHLRKDN